MLISRPIRHPIREQGIAPTTLRSRVIGPVISAACPFALSGMGGAAVGRTSGRLFAPRSKGQSLGAQKRETTANTSGRILVLRPMRNSACPGALV